MLALFLYGINACSGDTPVSFEKKPNLWKLRASRKIKQLETGTFVIGLFIACVIAFVIISKILYAKRKIKYRVRTDILHSDERRNLSKETYI